MIFFATSKTQKNMQKMGILEREVLFLYDTQQKVSQACPFTSSDNKDAVNSNLAE